MPRKLWLDTETRSPTPISNGVHRYAEDAEVTLFQWALDDGPVHVWDRTEDATPPAELVDDALLADEVWAHNASFDSTVLEVAHPDLWDLLGGTIQRWRCTMVQAYSHALPGALDSLCDVLKVPTDLAKDKEGRQLMLFFCKPRPDGTWADRTTHPDKWERFKSYAGRDITAMRECHRLMPKWNYPDNTSELALWHLDQRINARGVLIDLPFVTAAVAAVLKEQKRLGKAVNEATGGQVSSATKRDQLLRHLIVDYGYTMDDLRASTIDFVLGDPDVPDALKYLLKLRKEASTASVAKYKKMLSCVGSDGRLRGTAQFNGAGRTGRFAHRLVQPGNLPRPTVHQTAIDLGIEAITLGAGDIIVNDLMATASSAVRGSFIAPQGRKLCISDLANIEGRVVAWLGGEDWKIQAFRDYDTVTGEDEKGKPIRKGPDLYTVAYAKAFNMPIEEVNKYQRQIGKILELMLGYAGGCGAFITGAATYHIDLEDMAMRAIPIMPDWATEQATGFLEWIKEIGGNTYGLEDFVFVACDGLKRLWRAAHPGVVQLWADLQDGAVTALAHPGELTPASRVNFIRDGAWLRCYLPSGRALCYPGIKWDPEKRELSYLGVNQYSRKWSRIKTYGGKLCLAEGTLVLARRGWVPIQSVFPTDKVWDGVEWVSTDGAVCNGAKEVIQAYGAWMTPDHEVLTEDGWKHASQSGRYHRAACRLPDGVGVPRSQRQEVDMASSLRLRQGDLARGDRDEEASRAGHNRFLRVHATFDDRREEDSARDVPASSLRRVGIDVRSLSQAFSRGLASVRRAGDQGLHRLGALLRCVLEGHGADVLAWADAGAQGQQRPLLAGELHLGDVSGASAKHVKSASNHDPRRLDDWRGVLAQVRSTESHGVVSLAPRRSMARTRVYDLINCGPRRRFVIAAGGLPLIVHNCENISQAIARDVLTAAMGPAEARGYETVLHVHDELVTETPDDAEHSAEELSELLATNPPWAQGLPLAAAGFETDRYRKSD